MSKAFTKESDRADSEAEEANPLPAHAKNYVTPAGLAALQEEFRKLLYEERPKSVSCILNKQLRSCPAAEWPEIEVRARFVKEAVYEKSKLAFPWNDTQPELVTSVGGEDLPIVVEACAQNMVIDSSSLWFWGDRFVNVIEAS